MLQVCVICSVLFKQNVYNLLYFKIIMAMTYNEIQIIKQIVKDKHEEDFDCVDVYSAALNPMRSRH